MKNLHVIFSRIRKATAILVQIYFRVFSVFYCIYRDEGAVTPPPPTVMPGLGDLSLGTKMRVRYGRGRNQREYEAKVFKSEKKCERVLL